MNKNIKIFINYFFGPLLFAWLAFSIYRQISNQPQLEQSWRQIKDSFHSSKIFYLFAAFVLIFFNWGLEAWKWKISVETIHRIPFIRAFEAVLSGVSFSVTMPNRVGEYLGRMLYLPEGQRLKTISVTLVGSFAQLLVTVITGTIGLTALKASLLQHFPKLANWYLIIVSGLIAIIVVMLLVYFNVADGVKLFRKWIKSERYIYLVEALKNFHVKLLLQLLLISFLRYMVFIVQYVFIFYLFEVNIPVWTIILVMSIIFLAMAIVPSIALVEVGLRGEISIKLMGIFTANTLGIGLSSISVWFLNLILPAILGSLLLLNMRIFKKKNETA